MDPALREILWRGSEDDEVEAVIRFTEDAAPPPAGVRLVTRFGTIATCRLKRGDIEQVRENEVVANLKASRLLGPDEHSTQSGKAFPVPDDARRPPHLVPRGRGVVVGVLDWGLDFVSDSFRGADGGSRLLALWDQRIRNGPGHANRYGYGTIHDRTIINAALRSRDPYQALDYHPADADPYSVGAHGTVVADIAAGNGRSGGPEGVAPESSIVFVHLASRGTSGLANLGDSIGILEGLDFIRRVAGNRPLAVSLSVGRHGGPHDGCTPVERAFDWFLSSAHGRTLSQSSGNYGLKQTHASGVLHPGTSRSLRLIVDSADPSLNELEIWHQMDRCSVRLDAPDGTTSSWVAVGAAADMGRAGRLIARVYHRKLDPQNRSHHVDAFIYPGAPAGEWTVSLRDDRTSGEAGQFDAWIERDDACAACQSRFRLEDADPACTLGTLANGDQSLTCGAFDAHDPARPTAAFASAGPTRDGRSKPDFAAPGVGILATRSQPRVHGPFEALTRKSGTSMAAPQVAGCTALLLELTAGRLRNDDVKDILLSTVDPASANADGRLGAGYLNIARAVDVAQRHADRWRRGRGGFIEMGTGQEAAEEAEACRCRGSVTHATPTEDVGAAGPAVEMSDDPVPAVPSAAGQKESAPMFAEEPSSKKRRFVIVSGGPGRFHPKDKDHDTGWSNYVDPPLLKSARTDSTRKTTIVRFWAEDEEVHWLVFKPAYEARWTDDAAKKRTAAKTVKDQGFKSYVDKLEARAAERGWTLHWMTDADDLWTVLDGFPAASISRVWYYGHAATDLWLSLDHYDSGATKAPPADHIIAADKIKDHATLKKKFEKAPSAHDPNRTHRFLGCNTSTFAEAWSKTFRVWADGMFGKVEFEAAHTDPSHDPSPVGSCELKRYKAGASASVDTEFSETEYGEADDAEADDTEAEEPRYGPSFADLAEAIVQETRRAKGSDGASDVLRALLQAGGGAIDASLYAPDRFYRRLTSGSVNVGGLQIVGAPGAPLREPLQRGDVLVRVALGEPGLGHVAVLADGQLMTGPEMQRAGARSEGGATGLYAIVVEPGVRPHIASDAFARLIIDGGGRTPPAQIIVRAAEPAGVSGLAAGDAQQGDAQEVEQTAFPFLEEFESDAASLEFDAAVVDDLLEQAPVVPVVHAVGRLTHARKFVDMPLTYEDFIANAEGTGIVVRRTRCSTLAHVTAQGISQTVGEVTLPVAPSGGGSPVPVRFFANMSHADIIRSMSAQGIFWQVSPSGALQVALDLVVMHPADPADPTRLPRGTEQFPLVVICHGNHSVCETRATGAPTPAAAIPPLGAGPSVLSFPTATFHNEVLSHHGYSAATRTVPPGSPAGPSISYLQEELARHGIISVSVSHNPANYFDLLLETRADLVLKAVGEMRRVYNDRSSPLHRRIDFDRVAFIGHSRGGDAVIRAALKQRSLNVRALVQLAPTDMTGLVRGTAPAAALAGRDRTDVVAAPMSVTAALEAFHLILYGSRDGDVSGFQDVRADISTSPFRHYDRSSAHRAFHFWHDANHSRFNRFWEDPDEGRFVPAPAHPAPLVDLAGAPPLLARPDHEARTSETVGACLRFVLNREAAEAGRLDGRTPTTIAPAHRITGMWKFGASLKTIDRFEDIRSDRNTLGGRNVPPPSGLVDEIQLANENPTNAGTKAFQFVHIDRVLRASLPSSPLLGMPGGAATVPSGRWRAQIPFDDRNFSAFTLLTLRVTKKFDPADIRAGTAAMPQVRVRLVDNARATQGRNATGRLSALPSLRPVRVSAGAFGRKADGTPNPPVDTDFDLTKYHLETWAVALSTFDVVNRAHIVAVEIEMIGRGGEPVYVDTISLVRLL